jgi:hypothetical protein
MAYCVSKRAGLPRDCRRTTTFPLSCERERGGPVVDNTFGGCVARNFKLGENTL